MKWVLLFIASIGLLAMPVAAQNSSQPENLQYLGLENRTPSQVRQLASIAAETKLAVIVWGGDFAFQQEVYNAARDITDGDISIAFVRAPSIRNEPNEAVIEIYAASTSQYSEVWNNTNLAEVRSTVVSAARYLNDFHIVGMRSNGISFVDGRYHFNGQVVNENQLNDALRLTLERLDVIAQERGWSEAQKEDARRAISEALLLSTP